MTTKEKLSQLKEQFIQEILNSDLTKLEKLKQINENDLFAVAGYIQHVFSEQEKQLAESVKEKIGQDWVLTDDIFLSDTYEKYQTVNLVNLLEDYYEDYLEGNTGKITVVTNRHNNDIIELTYPEFEDIIYNWCVSNKMIGFEMDW